MYVTGVHWRFVTKEEKTAFMNVSSKTDADLGLWKKISWLAHHKQKKNSALLPSQNDS